MQDQRLLCAVRKKWFVATSEEIIRQNFIKVINEAGICPISRMKCEHKISFGKINLYADLVCFDKKLRPKLLCEFKSPNIKINKDALTQISFYQSIIRSAYILISNSVESIIIKINTDGSLIQLTSLEEIKI